MLFLPSELYQTLGDAPGQNLKEFNIKLLHASARQPLDPLHATMQRPNLQRVCSSNPPRGFLCVALLTSVELADNVGCMHTNMPRSRRLRNGHPIKHRFWHAVSEKSPRKKKIWLDRYSNLCRGPCR